MILFSISWGRNLYHLEVSGVVGEAVAEQVQEEEGEDQELQDQAVGGEAKVIIDDAGDCGATEVTLNR